MSINIKISGENVINLRENEEITLWDIYNRMERHFRICDAKDQLSQDATLCLDDEDNEISDEEFEALAEEVADKASRNLEKNDGYWDYFWGAFDEAIRSIKEERSQYSMF